MTSNIDKNSINAQVQYKMIEKLSLMNERLKKEVLVRKKAERESNYARIRLEAIIENLNSGILVEDENRRITTANQVFCDLFSMPIK